MTARTQESGPVVPDRGRAAVDLLGVLFPPPYAVAAGSPGGGPGRAVVRRWTAVPSAASPRLLVPDVAPGAAGALLRRQLTGSRWRTRAARAGLSVAASAGVLGRLPGMRLEVTGPVGAASIEDPLTAALGVPAVRLTMPVGPARATRKPVLQVTDRQGRVLAFAKVGHTDLTGRLVRSEGAALATLAQAGLVEARVPRVLARLEWHGREVLVLEALDVPSRRLTGVAARRRLLDLVAEVAALGGRSTVTWGDHALRDDLLARARACEGYDGRLARQVHAVPTDLPVPTGSWHGDLNGGNLALVDGPCPVWDWERFETGVPVGFDLLHHDLHQAVTVRGTAPRTAASALLAGAATTLAPLDVPAAAAEHVARLYLVTLACRYLADGQERAGADLGRVHEWLLPALEEEEGR